MRSVRVQGVCLVGAEAELVSVEARFEAVERERVEIVLSGLPDSVIRESRGRLRCALEEAGLRLPRGRLFLHLAPAGLRKAGEILDLPMALGAAAAAGHLAARELAGTLFLGEVGIDGRLHAVPGGLAAALSAERAGIARLLAPPATAREAASIAGVRSFAAESLADVLAWIADPEREASRLDPAVADAPLGRSGAELDRVRGQGTAKLALAAAAAGGHALLFTGPPGVGKSMLARALRELLPAPTLEERIEITRVLSAARRWPGGLARERPFRAPHHTSSHAGLVGGGNPPRPGEITLAHRGVLFLDELPELARDALESLRQPLETGHLTIARAGRQLELPARFHLVAAMNPCPCGFRGHARLPCRCSATQVQRYRRRISGPLLDRIELRVELSPPPLDELAGPPRAARDGPAGAELAARCRRARERARERQGALPNAELEGEGLDRWAPLAGRARALVESAAERRGLSARAVQALRRVARTLADLDDADAIDEDHWRRALGLRACLEPRDGR